MSFVFGTVVPTVVPDDSLESEYGTHILMKGG